MSQCRKDRGYGTIPKYLFIFSISICLLSFSSDAFSQGDTTRRERPQPPPRPKLPSLKEMVNKINIFKKHKDDPAADKATTTAETEKKPDPVPPPPPPAPKPDPVKPKTTVKHVVKKKKTTKSKTATDKKKTDRPTQPLI